MAVPRAACADDRPSIEPPTVLDKSLIIELIAAEPEIVTPFGIAADAEGRIYVVESHTHMRPDDYAGPLHDRLRMIVDTDGDGVPDRVSTFYEGERWLMNVAAHRNGWIYCVSRNELFRIRDTDGDGRADVRESLAEMETTGDYPHNGFLSVSIGSNGSIYFGMGQNYGAAYVLRGRDGRKVASGRGDGGVFRCAADGTGLVRRAVGFWNPCGIAEDAYGRIFTVDNDPGNRPPCRLIEVVSQGDYGYRRRELEPFISWNGELPGTLPMVASCAEAPTDIIQYRAVGLPVRYRGAFLVSSWNEHRIDAFRLAPSGAGFRAESVSLVTGGPEFRPAGLAVGPDGSLYVSDWVDRSYPVHGRGRVWRLRWKERPEIAGKPPRQGNEVRPDGGVPRMTRRDLDSADAARREQAVRTLSSRFLPLQEILARESNPRVRAAAWRRVADPELLPSILEAVRSDDPMVRHAATLALQRSATPEQLVELTRHVEAMVREAAYLALRDRHPAKFDERLEQALDDRAESIRYLAVVWIGEKERPADRGRLLKRLETGSVSPRLFDAMMAALARIGGVLRQWRPGRNGDWWKTRADVDRIAVRLLRNERLPPETIRCVIEFLPPGHHALTVSRLRRILREHAEATGLQLAAVRAIPASSAGKQLLRQIAEDTVRDVNVRAEAIMRLDPGTNREITEQLVGWAESGPPTVRRESLRTLRGATLNPEQRARLKRIAGESRELNQLVALVLQTGSLEERPPLHDLEGWLARLEGPADRAAGRRVFFHPRGPGCAKCHWIDGRGATVGPGFVRTRGMTPYSRRALLQSILQPSAEIALGYVPYRFWLMDGRVVSGVLLTETDTAYRIVDTDGREQVVPRAEIETLRPSPTSIMPDGLVHTMTDAELRDVIEFIRRGTE